MTWLELLTCCFATYRLSLMVSKESGPMRIFRKLRNLPPPKSSAREGLSCQHCTSVWFAAVIIPWWIFGGYWSQVAILILAASGAAICLHHAFTADKN